MTADYSQFDDVLGALAPYSPDLKNTNTSHISMAAEALTVMGYPDQAKSWALARLDDIVPRKDVEQPVTEADWQDALGAFNRFSDWYALFETELAREDWRVVLVKWMPRLAPGFAASATHGIIRAGHAVRVLEAGDSPARRAELSDGLALWADTFQALPEEDSDIKGLSPADALAQVPLVPEDLRRNQGAITYALTALQEHPSFAGVINLIDPDGDPVDLVKGLADLFIQIFLSHAKDGLSAIVFTHSVTSLAAALAVAPHIGDAARRSLLRYGWQGAAGLYACYGDPDAEPRNIDPETPEAIRAEALAHGDDHVIKLSEVCLRFFDLTGNDDFLRAPQLARQYLRSDTRGLA